VAKKTAEWLAANPGYITQKMREWRMSNPEEARAAYRRQNEKRVGRIDARIRKRLSEAIRQSLRTGKGGRRTFELLGCTLEEFKHHIELQFLPGMSWANIAEWEIDHILPLAAFSYASVDDPEFRAAWALSNLRPFWSLDNAKKGAKVLHLL
jgi:hypothetical protein